MAIRTKTGGRKAGTPNRERRELMELIEEQFHNYHPVVELAKIANNKKNPISLRFQAHKEVAKYVSPQLKSVELKETTTLETFLNMTQEERKETLEKLKERL